MLNPLNNVFTGQIDVPVNPGADSSKVSGAGIFQSFQNTVKFSAQCWRGQLNHLRKIMFVTTAVHTVQTIAFRKPDPQGFKWLMSGELFQPHLVVPSPANGNVINCGLHESCEVPVFLVG